MSSQRTVRLVSLLLAMALLLAPCTGSLTAAPNSTERAFVEPGLLSQSAAEVSIILTADSARSADRAVRHVGGRVTSELWLIDAVAAVVRSEAIEQLARQPGVRTLVMNKGIRTADKPAPSDPDDLLSGNDSDPLPEDGWVTSDRFPVPWDGSPDVQPTSSWNSRRVVYPVKIDIGADQVNWTGTDVTVATIDSGVYFSDAILSEMGHYLRRLYLGQADFVETSCETAVINNSTVVLGQQFADYCFTGLKKSKDGYGHGTFVAGLIWNRISDYMTGVDLGVAREARILGIRVLGNDGAGTYETVIKGVQYAVANKAKFNIGVINLSLSATQSVPYFMDPLDRAVEQAWKAGIVVVAAAGNEGPRAETITVPGNDPYVITVGAVDGRRTPGYWKDDIIPSWSSSGPTLDGFIKPDLLAPAAQLVSFMYNDYTNPQNSAYLVQQHPDYSLTSNLFRMSGTSMATAVTSGVVALMLQKNASLTPDQVKYRLMATARQVNEPDGQPAFGLLQQGAGRLWVPEAVEVVLEDGSGNPGMNLEADLAAGWGSLDADGQPVLDPNQLSQHYLGPVRMLRSDDGSYRLYLVENADRSRVVLGIADAGTGQWVLPELVPAGTSWSSGSVIWSGVCPTCGGTDFLWSGGQISWHSDALYDAAGNLVWAGGVLVWSGNGLYDAAGSLIWSGGELFDAAGNLVWSGSRLIWSGGSLIWSGQAWEWNSGELLDGSGNLIWSGGNLIWSGGQLFDPAGVLVWSGGELYNAAGALVWSGSKLIWSGGQLVDPAGSLIWAGGRLVWSGGMLQGANGASYSPQQYDTSLLGENLSWSSGSLIWSGGSLIWSGGTLVWSGSSSAWDAAKLIWSGGSLIWSGGLGWTKPVNTSSTRLQTSRWVNW